MRYTFPLFLALSLTACAADNLSEGAGQSRVDVDVALAEPGQVPYIKTVRIVDGKERDLGEVTFRFHDGKPEVTYKGRAERAFQGQEAAAIMVQNVTKALADAGVAVTPSIVDAILKAVAVP